MSETYAIDVSMKIFVCQQNLIDIQMSSLMLTLYVIDIVSC